MAPFSELCDAGGDLGHLLAGNPVGIVVWRVAGGSAFALITPAGAAAMLAAIGAGASTAWGWRLPQRAWASVGAVKRRSNQVRTAG